MMSALLNASIRSWTSVGVIGPLTRSSSRPSGRAGSERAMGAEMKMQS
jgi:hypothetical protein